MKFSNHFQEAQKEVRRILQQYILLIFFVFVIDRFSNMTKSKISKCSWLIGVNATSDIIRNVSLYLKTFPKIVDWVGFVQIVNLRLP